MTSELINKHCEACDGNVPPLQKDQIETLLKDLYGWELDNGKLHKKFTFKDFKHLMSFVNRMAELAENEAHHPDFFVSYDTLEVSIFTYKVKALTKNDFILAAKIDALPRD